MNIERTFRQRLRTTILRKTGSVEVSVRAEQVELMVVPQRSISDYAILIMEGATSSTVRLLILATNFKLKLNFIQMVQQMCQFDGLQDENSYVHLTNFLEICDIFKAIRVTADAIRIRLFPFSVRRRAKRWLVP